MTAKTSRAPFHQGVFFKELSAGGGVVLTTSAEEVTKECCQTLAHTLGGLSCMLRLCWSSVFIRAESWSTQRPVAAFRGSSTSSTTCEPQ